MSTYKSDRELNQVVRCQLGLISAEEMKNMSAGEINNIQPYEYPSMYPTKGGVNDARMGTTNRHWNCTTCEGSSIDCPGHFGHISLAQPVYHIGFLPTIKKILTCICFKCRKLLCPTDTNQVARIRKLKNGADRQSEIVKLCANKMECVQEEDQDQLLKQSGCGYRQPKFAVNMKKMTISIRENEINDEDPNQERNLLPIDCQEIFKQISDEDCYLLGFDVRYTRPENMIISVLPVAPPSIRPAVQMESTQRAEDDLTHMYVSILKINKRIKDQYGLPPSQLEKYLDQLQYYVGTMINNDVNGVEKAKRKSGQPIKSIRERLRGKEGRFRKNLMGKRVDFCARTVVSPDPNLNLDQLGVPRTIAMNLTFPETVTQLNMERLKQLISNGPSIYPGAKTIIRNDGKSFDLRYIQNRDDIQLDYGMIVERHIVDGDYVVFNRQPTLHKMSMMGHKIKILPYSSFRLNLSVTTPYNADFDGDEMNMHVPQSYETITEIKNIMHVPRQIVSPQSNRPVMGVVQDALMGIRLFTRRSTFLRKDQVFQLLMWVEDWNGEIPPPAILKPERLWTGKQIISLILPNVNLERKCNVFSHPQFTEEKLSQRDGKIIIERGELLCGMLDKGTVGNTAGGVIHSIWLDEGPAEAAKFLSQAQKIINNWIIIHGFSVGASDIFPDEECEKLVAADLQKVPDVLPNLYRKAQSGKMDHQPGKSMLESFEANVNNDLNNRFKEASSKAQSSMNDNNRIYCMVAAGSKGSDMNIAQIMVCVGQQNVEGKRIPNGFNRRTLPHFQKDDYSPASRGFVSNSYLTGLTPSEMYFHAMGGREGLIDTAVKTSETGYMSRKLIKCMEDVMIKNDQTVRDCTNNLVQFIYGEDGMSAEFLEGVTLSRFLEMRDKDFQREFLWFQENQDIDEALNEYEGVLDEKVLEDVITTEGQLEKLQNEYLELLALRDRVRSLTHYDAEQKFYLPVNLSRIINNVKIKNKHLKLKHSTISPIFVIDQVNQILDSLYIVNGVDTISQQIVQNAGIFLKASIKMTLAAKRVCVQEKFTKEMLMEILGEIQSKYNQAKAHPGEMIGCICAQSIGEPTTQMTLNTFHAAGISSRNVTLGVPRIKEIINATRNIKTPSMTIFTHLKTADSEQEALKQLQSSLEFTTLQHLSLSSEIYYDPEYDKTIIAQDTDIVDDYIMYPDEEDIDKVSSWVLRIQLDKNALIDRKITSEQIKKKIMEHLPKQVQIIYDANLMPTNPVLRIRLRELGIPPKEQVDILKGIEYKLLKTYELKGVPGVKKVFMKKDKRRFIKEDGAIGFYEEWILETDGSNLPAILRTEGVDNTRTFSNNILEMYDCLGVEAARQSIIKEIQFILSQYGIYINHRHLITLTDIMARTGYIRPATRHGINKICEGPFRKASFEQSVEQLFTAGIFSEVQNMLGISESIMFGQLAPMGTGSFKIMLDTKEVQNAKYIPNDHHEQPDDLNALFQEEETELFGGQTPMGLKTPAPISNTPSHMQDMDISTNIFTPFRATSPRAVEVSTPYNPRIPTKANNINIYEQYSFYNRLPMQSPKYPSSLSPGYQSPGLLNYSPGSPYQGNSLSPSYSHGGHRMSPHSPSYIKSVHSPQYGLNAYSVSPSSPNYSGSPLSQTLTPSSGGQGIYSPNSPQYNLQTNQYNPKSPGYDPNNCQQDSFSESSEDEEEN